MRDLILIVIIVGSVPICLMSPFYGVMMWYWVSYFNPHRFTWSYGYDFPVALLVAVPTLIGTVFAQKSIRSLFMRESILLICIWAWYAFTFLHAQGIPFFTLHMPDAKYEINHISKILLMTLVMIAVITTRVKLRGVMLVTALSLGLLAVKGMLFGLRTGGESRVWGPPDSFLADNNAFGLALNMCLPLLFFLAQDEKNKWLKLLLRVCFAASILSVILTYSRGGLLGLGVVLAAITLKSRHKLIGGVLLAASVFVVFTLAPSAWMSRMSQFMSGDLDASANQRLVAWETAWQFAKDYPVTGGGFDTLPDVNVFQHYQLKPLPLGYTSTGPHSIYFQLLSDQGFVGLGLFLLLVASCFWTLWRIRRTARILGSSQWLVNYANMVEIAILGFMVSGAFLGFLYLDVIYQMIASVVVLKTIFQKEVTAHLSKLEEERSAVGQSEPQPALA
jgi:probable O-glycosylation ligase (exosortase A-associated)